MQLCKAISMIIPTSVLDQTAKHTIAVIDMLVSNSMPIYALEYVYVVCVMLLLAADVTYVSFKSHL